MKQIYPSKIWCYVSRIDKKDFSFSQSVQKPLDKELLDKFGFEFFEGYNDEIYNMNYILCNIDDLDGNLEILKSCGNKFEDFNIKIVEDNYGKR